jgi:hypothetical protein
MGSGVRVIGSKSLLCGLAIELLTVLHVRAYEGGGGDKYLQCDN